MSALTDLFTSIANAIREKTGKTESIQASQFAAAIGQIQGGGNFTVEDVQAVRVQLGTSATYGTSITSKAFNHTHIAIVAIYPSPFTNGDDLVCATNFNPTGDSVSGAYMDGSVGGLSKNGNTLIAYKGASINASKYKYRCIGWD